MAVWEKYKVILYRWGPVAVWAGIIYWLSSWTTLPGAKVFVWDFALKKSAHMVMYAGLFYWIQRALHWRTDNRYWSVAGLLTVLYAVSDEYHQTLVPGRTGLPMDVGFDSLGTYLGYLKIRNLL